MSGGVAAAKPAGFWIRALAQVIDLFWLMPLSALLTFLGELVNGGSMSFGGWAMGQVVGALVVLSFWAERQGTPGKLVLGLVIVDSRTGGVPGLRQLVVRYLGFMVSVLALFLGCLWVAWDPAKRGWHDMMAGTLVVRDPRR